MCVVVSCVVGSFWLDKRLCSLFVNCCVMLYGLLMRSCCCCGFNVLCVLRVIRCVSVHALFFGLCVCVCVCVCVKLVYVACDVLCDVVWCVVVL